MCCRMTPLKWAAEKENVDVTQMLLEAGADPNVHIGKDGTDIATALRHAVEKGNAKITKLLLHYGTTHFSNVFL